MNAEKETRRGDARSGSRAGARFLGGVGGAIALLIAAPLGAADDGTPLGGALGLDAESAPVAVRFLAIVTVLGVVPSIVLLATCFPRILIVLSFLRRALGTHELPPQSVLGGLALVLTALVMLPVARRVHDDAYVPLRDGRVETVEEALVLAEKPVKEFMLSHTLRSDLLLMVDLAERGKSAETATPPTDESAGESQGATAAATVPPRGSMAESPGATPVVVEDLPFFVVLPAFVLSELKLAFQMGFLILLPFVVIDLAVSAVLLSMGMFMLPPVLVSLPLKILVFVLVDGWHLVVGQLVSGFAV